MQSGEMPYFFNTPHAFKKIGEMQFGEMPHTRTRPMTIFLTRGFHRIWWLVFQVNMSPLYTLLE